MTRRGRPEGRLEGSWVLGLRSEGRRCKAELPGVSEPPPVAPPGWASRQGAAGTGLWGEGPALGSVEAPSAPHSPSHGHVRALQGPPSWAAVTALVDRSHQPTRTPPAGGSLFSLPAPPAGPWSRQPARCLPGWACSGPSFKGRPAASRGRPGTGRGARGRAFLSRLHQSHPVPAAPLAVAVSRGGT